MARGFPIHQSFQTSGRELIWREAAGSPADHTARGHRPPPDFWESLPLCHDESLIGSHGVTTGTHARGLMMRRSSDSGQHTTGNVTQVHPLYTSEMKQANVFEWFDETNVFEWFDLCTSEIDDLDREGSGSN